MPTYQEYQDQIAELQTLAEQAKQIELANARERIEEMMKANGLTIADLRDIKKPMNSKKQGSVAAKYKDPESGQTWAGRWRPPSGLSARTRMTSSSSEKSVVRQRLRHMDLCACSVAVSLCIASYKALLLAS